MRISLFLSTLFFIFVSSQSHAVDFIEEMKKQEITGVTKTSGYCEMSDSNDQEVSGYRVDSLVKIASVSKLFTSYLAVSKFGPFYRFTTRFKVVQDGDQFDLFVLGDGDPYMNFEKLFFVVSELNRAGYQSFRSVYFDQNVRSYLAVRNPRERNSEYRVFNPPERDWVNNLLPQDETKRNLSRLLNTSRWSVQMKKMYQETVQKAAAVGVQMTETPEMSSGQIVPVTREELDSQVSVQTVSREFVMKSPPLYQYLKDTNKYSINFISDQLFLLSGGRPAMEELLTKTVGLTSDQFDFWTGSGLPNRIENKQNRASCKAVVKVLNSFAKHLNTYNIPKYEMRIFGRPTIRLADVAIVVGRDDGSYQSGDEAQQEAVAIKTGTLSDSVNGAGYVSTQQGIVWFGIFMNGIDLGDDKGRFRNFREKLITILIGERGGRRPIVTLDPPVEDDRWVPFVKESQFEEVNLAPVLAPAP